MSPYLSYSDDGFSEDKRMKITLLLRFWSVVVLVSTLAILTVILSACEYPGVPHPLAGEGPGGALPTPSLRVPEPPDSPNEELPPESIAKEGIVQVALKDFKLEPDQLTVKAGQITFVLTNEGRFTLDFRVEGQGVDEKAPKVPVGREFRWELTLAPGEYRISCPISNHDERGMVGTLVVVE